MPNESDFSDEDDMESSIDAIELLTADHEEVKALFADYESLVSSDASAEEREALALEICNALTAHATAEEEIFYPAARDATGETELLDEAEADHASAKDLIAQILAMAPGDDRYDGTVRVLQEAVEHHVREEEGELFPRVQESAIDLDKLGEQIAERKEEVLSELQESAA